MKIFSIMGLLSLILGAFAEEPALEAPDAYPAPGWTRAQVLDALGSPRGTIQSDTAEFMSYDRGLVKLRHGVVESAELMGTKEAATLRIQREEQEARSRTLLAERQHQLAVEGVAERDRMLADPNFIALPPSRQLELWRLFALQYPGVNVSTPILVAQSRSDAEAEKVEWLRRITQLEQRVADAEQRAALAEQTANRVRTVYVPTYSYPPFYPPRRPPPLTPPHPHPPPASTNQPGPSVRISAGP